MNSAAFSEILSDDQRWALLEKRRQEHNAAKAFRLFRENGIEPILIKGLAAGLWYPAGSPRRSLDLDIAVSSRDFPAADALIRTDAAAGLAVDLHSELRHLDTLAWDELMANARDLQLEDGSIRVLSDEDHLRVVCVHWLTDGGSNKDRLRDIFYAIRNRPSTFDWNRFLDASGPRRRRWFECTVGIAARSLDLDLSGTPIADAAERVPAWVIGTIEKEWSAEVAFEPLEVVVHSRRHLASQLARRIWPNPIRATIESEGNIDAPIRLHYQAADIVRRIIPSVKRIAATFR